MHSQWKYFLHRTLHVSSHNSFLRCAVGDIDMRGSITSVAQNLWKFGPPPFPDTFLYPGLQNKDTEYENSLKCVDDISNVPDVIRTPYSPWHNLHHPVDAHHTKQRQAHAEPAKHIINWLTWCGPLNQIYQEICIQTLPITHANEEQYDSHLF